MLRLLLVEDSVTQREILRRLIDADARLCVVAEARNGREAVACVARYQPDVVLMDIHMPDMDGVEATREIMRRTPVPIVIASASLKEKDVDLGLEALKAGAVSVVEKPQGAVLLHLGEMVPQLCGELVGAAQAKIKPRSGLSTMIGRSAARQASPGPIDAIGICASTGGPPVLLEILSQLPHPFPLPVLIVQHISPGFVNGFARWLGDLSEQQVGMAEPGRELTPGFWLSPGGKHLCVDQRGRFYLQPPSPREIHCPSANQLLSSLANHYGPRALGILLTGMGDDGAEGMVELRNAGGRTVAQNEATSLIFGMPRAAIEQGGADAVLAPDAIIQLMVDAARPKTVNPEGIHQATGMPQDLE